MIKKFKHKGIEDFLKTGSKAGIQTAHASKLARQLRHLNLMDLTSCWWIIRIITRNYYAYACTSTPGRNVA